MLEIVLKAGYDMYTRGKRTNKITEKERRHRTSDAAFSKIFKISECSARDWERSGLLEENPQSGCSDIWASLKGPL
jgi:hypothetical protein